MNQPNKSRTEGQFTGWHLAAFILFIYCVVSAAQWAWMKLVIGWHSFWGAVFHAGRVIGLCVLALVALLVLATLVDGSVRWVARAVARRNAPGFSPIPSLEALSGKVPLGRVEAFFARVFSVAYYEQTGMGAQGLATGTLAELRRGMLPDLFRRPEVRAEHLELVGALYSLAQTNVDLQAWVGRRAAASRRRRFGWIFMRALPFALGGWSEAQSIAATTKEEMLGDARKFEDICLSGAGFMALPLFARVLREQDGAFDTKAELVETQLPSAEHGERGASTESFASDEVAMSQTCEPETINVHAETQTSADTRDVRGVLVALSEGLRVHHGGWNEPAILLAEAREVAEDGLAEAPKEATKLLALVEGMETRLPLFAEAYAAQQQVDDVERFAPWMKRALRESTSASDSMGLEQRLAAIAGTDEGALEAHAVRCFLLASASELRTASEPPEVNVADEDGATVSEPPVSETVPVAASSEFPSSVSASVMPARRTPTFDAATAAGFAG